MGGSILGRLEKKRALVVGGGQSVEGPAIGIGRAVAMKYAREGATVMVADRDIEAAQRTVDCIKKEGFEAYGAACDITRAGDCRTLVETIVGALGGVDVLHNNVGVARVDGKSDQDILMLEEDAWQGIMDTNLKGMWLMCKAAIPQMREQPEGGSIVNVSSISSVINGRYDMFAAYRMSKAGVNILTSMIAIQNGRYNIRANTILVGPVETSALHLGARQRGEDVEAARARMVLDMPLSRRPGVGWDIANASAYLASDEAEFVTGAQLAVDGGLTAGLVPRPRFWDHVDESKDGAS